MSTKQKLGVEPPARPTLSIEQIQRYLAPLHRLKTGLSTAESNHLFRATLKLSNGPLDTAVLATHLGLSHVETLDILNKGRGMRVLAQQRRYEKQLCKRGRRAGKPCPVQRLAIWWIDEDGLASLETRLPKKPSLTWPLELLPAKRREQIELVHFADDDLSETEAWWIANIIAMIHRAGGRLSVHRDQLGYEYGIVPGTARRYADLAEAKGYIRNERPELKGKRTRPKNVYVVDEKNLERRRTGQRPDRPLSQGRSLLSVADCWPTTECWTPEQKQIVETIDRMIVGLSRLEVKKLLHLPINKKYSIDDWRDLRPILAATGDNLQTTYNELTAVLGCTDSQLEKVVRKNKAVNLLTVRMNNAGRAAKASSIIPTWRKMKRAANGHATNGAAKKQAASKVEKIESPPPPASVLSDYYSTDVWIKVFHRSWSVISRRMRDGKSKGERQVGTWKYRFPFSELNSDQAAALKSLQKTLQ